MEILTSQLSCAVEALGRANARPATCRHRHHQPAQTVIVWERETGRPIHPAIVCRTAVLLRSAASGGERCRRRCLQPHRAGAGPLFFRYQGGLDSGPRAGSAGAGRARRAAFGTVDSWLIWHLTSGSRHVTDVTTPRGPCCSTSSRASGTRSCCASSIFPQPAAGSGLVEPERGEVTTRWGWAESHCGYCGRPAGGAVRATVLAGGRGQEHLWNRLLPVAEHRHPLCAVEAPADYHAAASAGHRWSTPSRAASSSAGRWCSGCATT